MRYKLRAKLQYPLHGYKYISFSREGPAVKYPVGENNAVRFLIHANRVNLLINIYVRTYMQAHNTRTQKILSSLY